MRETSKIKSSASRQCPRVCPLGRRRGRWSGCVWGGKCGGLGFLLTSKLSFLSHCPPPVGLNQSRKALLVSFPFLPLCPLFICLEQLFPGKFPTLPRFLGSSAEILFGGWDGPGWAQTHRNGGSPGSRASSAGDGRTD